MPRVTIAPPEWGVVINGTPDKLIKAVEAARNGEDTGLEPGVDFVPFNDSVNDRNDRVFTGQSEKDWALKNAEEQSNRRA